MRTGYTAFMSWSVIGFEQQKKYLEQLLKQGELPHAFLFSGPEMIGKKLFAQELYRLANYCETLGDTDADLTLIAPQVQDGETKIYIDDIRQARGILSLTPVKGPYKFLVIDDADRLTAEASNALLKMLEEPPPFSVLILVTSQPRLLLPTIASRCERLSFLPHADEAVKAVLASGRVPQKDREFILSMAHGRIGWAMRMIEPGKLAEARKIVDDFQRILKKGIAERMLFAKYVTEHEDFQGSVALWIAWARGALYNGTLGYKIVAELVRLGYILSQPQYNHRLALEDFLLNV